MWLVVWAHEIADGSSETALQFTGLWPRSRLLERFRVDAFQHQLDSRPRQPDTLGALRVANALGP